MTDGHATPDHVANGRMLAIAELLRLGHRPAEVVAALKQIEDDDLEGAIRILTMADERTRS
jgi:uncharacterized protein (DUF433 family)